MKNTAKAEFHKNQKKNNNNNNQNKKRTFLYCAHRRSYQYRRKFHWIEKISDIVEPPTEVFSFGMRGTRSHQAKSLF